MMREIQIVGSGLVFVFILLIVLDEIFNATSYGSQGGPFSGLVDTIETTGTSALTLLVVGFIVVAASGIMRFFGAGFGGGGR